MITSTLTHPSQSADNKHLATQQRICDIDALRGITLFGILLVHTAELWGFNLNQYEPSQLGSLLKYIIRLTLIDRCAPVFSMLFGISFYLILKNPIYSGWKFMWRCVLLIGIGILNKIFYTTDILMWYGIWGIILLSIRNLPPRTILIIAILARIISPILPKFSLGSILFQLPISNRYVENITLSNFLSYPLSDNICAYLRMMLNGGILTGFSYMAFGYWVAKKGLINNIKYWATPKIILILFAIYAGFYMLGEIPALGTIRNISLAFGAALYATIFLYIYGKFHRGMKFLEAYGRMGLTNYSVQGMIGTCSMILFLLPYRLDFVYILLYFILIYIIQCIFSYYWLKYFKYGPMEYLWRSLVSFRFTNPLKNSDNF